MMIQIDQVKSRIEDALPGARVRVGTFSGDDHFEAVVEAPQFKGKTRIEQHRMVYAALDLHPRSIPSRIHQAPVHPEMADVSGCQAQNEVPSPYEIFR